jgi:hypothetical protein
MQCKGERWLYIIDGIYWQDLTHSAYNYPRFTLIKQDLTHSAYNYPRFTLIKLYRETTTANIE